MKRFHPLIAFAALLLCLVAVGGCGGQSAVPQTPVESAIALDKSFGFAVAGINTAYKNGDLKIEDKRAMAPAINGGNDVLKELWAKTDDGKKPITAADFGDVAAKVAVKMEALLRARADAEKAAAAKPKPALKPAAPVVAPAPPTPPVDSEPTAPPLPQ